MQLCRSGFGGGSSSSWPPARGAGETVLSAASCTAVLGKVRASRRQSRVVGDLTPSSGCSARSTSTTTVRGGGGEDPWWRARDVPAGRRCIPAAVLGGRSAGVAAVEDVPGTAGEREVRGVCLKTSKVLQQGPDIPNALVENGKCPGGATLSRRQALVPCWAEVPHGRGVATGGRAGVPRLSI